MDEDEWEEEDDENAFPERQAQKLDIALIGIGVLRGFAVTLAEQICLAERILYGHSNFQVSQGNFRDEAAKAIESITHNTED